MFSGGRVPVWKDENVLFHGWMELMVAQLMDVLNTTQLCVYLKMVKTVNFALYAFCRIFLSEYW